MKGLQQHKPTGSVQTCWCNALQVKDVIDGDLCEQFSQLPSQKQKQIADDLERSPGEVLKKLEDLRNQIY